MGLPGGGDDSVDAVEGDACGYIACFDAVGIRGTASHCRTRLWLHHCFYLVGIRGPATVGNMTSRTIGGHIGNHVENASIRNQFDCLFEVLIREKQFAPIRQDYDVKDEIVRRINDEQINLVAALDHRSDKGP